MSIVLAAVDQSPTCDAVLAAARGFADLLGATVEVAHVREAGREVPRAAVEAGGFALRELEGDPAPVLVAHARRREADLVVVGVRDVADHDPPVGHLAAALVSTLSAPVLVVPPPRDGDGVRRTFERVLVPLEGSEPSATAVADALERFTEAGMEIVVLHVFDADTIPRFWDAPGHAEDSFTASFSSRWCHEHDVDLHLRRGAAPDAVVEIAAAEDVDLVALGWSQDLRPGHAAVVRAALADCGVPVLLVPVS